MKRKRHRNLYIRRGLFAALAVIFCLLQNTPGLLPAPFGVHAWPLIPLVACVGMFERDTVGALLGLLAGLCWDSVSLSFGFHSIFLMLIGLFCGLLLARYMRNNFVTAMLFAAVACVLYALLHWFCFAAFTKPFSVRPLIAFYLPGTLYSFLLVLPCYFLCRAVMRRFRVNAG
jgi:rod shape-determining protein MreD